MILGTAPKLRKLDCNDSSDFPLFQINGEETGFTGNITYLGVQIDSSLNWKEQIKRFCAWRFVQDERNTYA